jgi:hypothetical protein
MKNDTHPVLRALRGLCYENLPQYDVLIALIQEELLTMPGGLDAFLDALREERSLYYSRHVTYELLSSAENPDVALLNGLFSRKGIDDGKIQKPVRFQKPEEIQKLQQPKRSKNPKNRGGSPQ